MKRGTTLVPHAGFIDADTVGAPGMVWHIDCTKLSKTTRGNSHCLNIMDAFSRFCKFYGIPDPCARLSAEKIVKYIGIFGCAIRIISDNGAEFNNELIQRLSELLGIKIRFITAYNSRGNGLVERPWSVLKEIVRCYHSKYENNWDVFLPLFNLAINTTINNSTGYSPFFLQFGRHPISPFEANIGSVSRKYRSFSDYAAMLEKELPVIFKLVSERSAELPRTGALKRTGDGKRADRELKPGDMVLVKNHYFGKGENKKLLPKFKREVYEVVSHPSGQAYQLRNLRTGLLNNNLINARELKRFQSDLIVAMEPGTFEVSKILWKRGEGENIEYLIEWTNHSDRYNSWVPAGCLDAPDMIREYERSVLFSEM